MLSNYQLNIANFYDIPIGNVKKLVLIFINEEMQLLHFENLKLYLSLGLKLKSISNIRIESITMAKIISNLTRKKE